MGRPGSTPDRIDYDKPSPARVYDAHLGGFHNFEVDRVAARQVAAYMPELPRIFRANRAFLGRATRFLVDAGIRQFLDLGSGIPTMGNVHEIAHAADPAIRVVYVDVDPVAVAHGREILADTPTATAVLGDLRRPDETTRDPRVRALLDFDEPVAVLMVAALHFVEDTDLPAGVVAAYRDLVVSGSYLAISHATQDGLPGRAEEAQDAYTQRVAGLTLRTHAAVREFFTGLDLVAPGLVYLTQWRPEFPDDVGDDPGWTSMYAGVARKP